MMLRIYSTGPMQRSRIRVKAAKAGISATYKSNAWQLDCRNACSSSRKKDVRC